MQNNLLSTLNDCFVTGTDTEVGKTYVTVKLMQAMVSQGLKVVGMKPVASGCATIDGIWQNEDVAKLIAASNVEAPREWVNPYCFDAPIAPHIAAQKQGITIDVNVIVSAYNKLKKMADVVIVEGAGGLLVPLNSTHSMADLIAALNLPTVLVVGMKLGCINHAMLTHAALKQRGLAMKHWVANHIDPNMAEQEENLSSLIHGLRQVPLLRLPSQST